MKKISIVVLVAVFALLGTIMFFNFESLDTSLRRKHHNTYGSYNDECRAACVRAGGISCGKYAQNCCNAAACDRGYWSETCKQRIPVANCTDP